MGNTMASHIKEQFPETEFCGFVHMRESYDFLHQQKDVVYTSLLLEEDIFKKIPEVILDEGYLDWLEKEYGLPNLWPYLYLDRILMNGQHVREYPHDKPLLSHHDMLRYLQIASKDIIEFLDRESPDVVIFSIVGNMATSLLYHIAAKKGIKTIIIEHARIDNRITVSQTYKRLTWTKERYDEIKGGRISPKKDAAKKYLKEFREHPTPYLESYTTLNKFATRKIHFAFLNPKKLFFSLVWHTKLLFMDIVDRKNKDYNHVRLWWVIWDKINRKARVLRGYDDLYSTPAVGEKYTYFPMHYDPETMTMLYSPFYVDQRIVIKAIARSLPVGMKLYVKDHAPMVGYRTRTYYKDISKIPNVRLLNPHMNGIETMKGADLITTINGTTGWEAILLNKPTIVFADGFFTDIPGVRRCKSFEDLPYLVKESLTNSICDESLLVDYVSALLEESVPVEYMDIWNGRGPIEEVMTNTNLKNLSLFIAEKIGLVRT